MIKRIFNSASKKDIEETFNSVFDYPYLYHPHALSERKKEALFCVITAAAAQRIQFAIWGILPQTYMGGWKKFQALHDTLEISYDSITPDSWLFESLRKRRCLIICTGFVLKIVVDDDVEAIKIGLREGSIFCIAGIYNVLEDGFMTCSILTQTMAPVSHNLPIMEPMIIPSEHYLEFLQRFNSQDINSSSFMRIDAKALDQHLRTTQHLRTKKFVHLI